MIVDGKTSIPQMAMGIRRYLIIVALVSLVVTGIYVALGERWVSVNISTLTSLGVALSVFLSFRNNVVYDRYWEARSLWGTLVNSSRTLARQMGTFVTEPDPAKHDALQKSVLCRQIAFVHALRAHLRDENTLFESTPFLPPDDAAVLGDARNVPATLLQEMGERLQQAWQAGQISDFHLAQMDQTLTDITNVLGGCEKIKNTPLPPAYTYLAHRIVLYYCCLVPFGLVSELHWFTPVLSLIVAFAFLTLDRISELIEMPFSTDPNDLPLTTLSHNIENDLRERMGERNLTPPSPPVDGVLL